MRRTVCCGENEAEIARRVAAIGREVNDLREHALCGTPAEIVDKIGVHLDAGAERVYLQVLDIRDLEQIELLAQEVQPHLPAR